MKIEQFVMAYGVEQDRLRALLPAPAQRCVGCGAPLLPGDAESYLKKTVNQGFEKALDYADLCPRCRRQAYIRNNS